MLECFGPDGVGGCPFRRLCKREYERNASQVQASRKMGVLPPLQRRGTHRAFALADFTVHMQVKVQ
jgi:hypothetical protein